MSIEGENIANGSSDTVAEVLAEETGEIEPGMTEMGAQQGNVLTDENVEEVDQKVEEVDKKVEEVDQKVEKVEENVLNAVEEVDENVVNAVEEVEDHSDDDDFGSFDDASIEEDLADETGEEEQSGEADSVENPENLDRPDLRIDSASFINLDTDKISEYTEKILSKMMSIYTVSKPGKEPAPAPILNERSTEILQRLNYTPSKQKIMNETAWKKSTIRREMLLTLGLPLNLDEVATGGSSHRALKANESQASGVSDGDLDLPKFEDLKLSTEEYEQILNTTSLYLDSLNIQKPEYYRSLTKPEKMDQSLESLQVELDKLKRIYVTWKSYESSLRKDNGIFQDYIENMVGNELKFRNERLIQQKLKRK